MKRVILTGATGYLGSRIAVALLAVGYEILCPVLRGVSFAYLEPVLPHVGLIETDADDFERIIANFRPDMVVHTAGRYARGDVSLAEIVDANLYFPLRLLAIVSEAAKDTTWLNTNTALDRNLNAYTLSKHQFGDWGRYYAETRGMRFCDILLEQFIGPKDSGGKLVPFLLEKMMENAPIDLTDGLQRRDFVYIDDVVNSYMLLALKCPPGYVELPLGTGQTPRVREVVETLKQLTGSRSELRFGAIPYRKGEPEISVADTGPLENLGYRCEITWQEGLRRIIREETL